MSLALGAALPAAVPTLVRSGTLTAWEHWKSDFLEESGRVIDEMQGGVSHSEGQGYGLLLAQAFGDRAAFDAIEAWTTEQLLIRKDALMAWRWSPSDVAQRETGARDWHTATDGDLFRAWALLRAEVFSGWGDYGDTVRDIANALVELCLLPDPRAPEEPVLSPSADAPVFAEGVLFNPSYVMSRALREVGAFAGAEELVRAADHGEIILSELASVGLVPDWVLVTPDGFLPATGYSNRHGYDAIRAALYLFWSGRGDHPAVSQKVALWPAGRDLPVVSTVDGQILERSTFAGYRAVSELIRCGRLAPGQDTQEPYYPATLGLLAYVARRESGLCDG
ncbi:glycosyl hydrolase family 5 [Maritimibacter sp. DP4N28-5]|uniref:cellulase n=2 Tax=Maritimibacter dapengensis TaxID=2836868 RepID=A0ABS6T5M7_9RHOB|nr:glycosyl hydrolase family 5 [Maritimibacter dapengensis]